MAELFYGRERDQDFFSVCEQVRKEKGQISATEIVSIALNKPAQSYYIRPQEYVSIARMNGENLPKGKEKQALHKAVLEKYKKWRTDYPDRKLSEFGRMMDTLPAPCFYLSHSRGLALYYELIKNPPQTE